MGRYESTWDRPEMPTSDLTSLHALFLAVIRFAVERFGGTIQTDPVAGITQLDIPDWSEDVCFRELGELLGPGKPLNAYLMFFCG